MIHSAISVIAEKVNTYLINRFMLGEDKLIMSNLVNQDGSSAVTEVDKLVMTLVNLQEERVASPGGSASRNGGYINAPVHLHMYILFSAYFSETNYEEALKFLSAIVGYFQANRFITRQTAPELDDGIDRLSFELANQDLQTQSHLWGVLGGKYIPSVMYNVRLVSVQEGVLTGTYSNVKGIN